MKASLCAGILIGGLVLTYAWSGQSVQDAFAKVFSDRNPRLVKVRVLDTRPITSARASNVLYVVHAIRADERFEGNFEDEQFGIFVVDAKRQQVVSALDIFRTRRWNDYRVEIAKVGPSHVVITGRGATYGDQRFTRTYDLP